MKDLRTILKATDELRKIGKALCRSYTYDCNYGLTKKQQERQNNLTMKAQEIAKQAGLHLYIQTDPRGGTMYVDTKPIPEDSYNQAIYLG